MGRHTNVTYTFGPYTLEPDQRRIRAEGGTPIELTAKAFDLLLLLTSRSGQLVTKDEILDEVWRDVSIAESNLTTTISMIRKALKEDSASRYIETVPKMGYRFVAAVTIGHERLHEEDKTPDQERPDTPFRAAKLVFAAMAIMVSFGTTIFLIQRKPGTETPYRRAVRLEVEGNDAQALATLANIPPHDDDYESAQLRAAWLAYQGDDNEAARGYIKKIATSWPKGAPGREAKDIQVKADGIQSLTEGNSNDALSRFQMATADSPGDTDALIYIADTSTAYGNFKIADDALQKCMKVDGLNPFCGYIRIEALTREGHFDAAMAEYDRLRKEGLKYPWLEGPAGYAELARGNVSQSLHHFAALATFGQQMASDLHYQASQEGIANVDAYLGQSRAANVQLEHAMETAKSGDTKAAYLLSMAEIDIYYGQKTSALKELQDSAHGTATRETAMSLAREFAMSGGFADARNVLDLNRAGSANFGKDFPASEEFVKGLESLDRKNAATAVEQLKDAVATRPFPESIYFLAQAQMRDGDWQSASETLIGLLNDDGHVVLDSSAALIPLAEYDLSLCYQKMGRTADAQTRRNSVLEIWKNADPEVKSAFGIGTP